MDLTLHLKPQAKPRILAHPPEAPLFSTPFQHPLPCLKQNTKPPTSHKLTTLVTPISHTSSCHAFCRTTGVHPTNTRTYNVSWLRSFDEHVEESPRFRRQGSITFALEAILYSAAANGVVVCCSGAYTHPFFYGALMLGFVWIYRAPGSAMTRDYYYQVISSPSSPPIASPRSWIRQLPVTGISIRHREVEAQPQRPTTASPATTTVELDSDP